MQWNDDRFAGFSTHEPWIKINENYPVVNVEHQKRDVNSIWNAYRALIELRNKEKALQYGEYDKLELIHDRIIFSRMYGKEKITVIINFGEAVKMDLPADVTILMGNEILETNQVLLYKEIH